MRGRGLPRAAGEPLPQKDRPQAVEATGDDAAASAPLLLSHWSCGNGCRVPELVDPAAAQRAHSSSHDAGPRLPGRVPV